MMQMFERRILRMIYGPGNDHDNGEQDSVVSFMSFRINQT
jgi:hypothetical protein